MSNVSSAIDARSDMAALGFEDAKLKRTTILTGNHHLKSKVQTIESVGRQRTMSENDQGLKSLQKLAPKIASTQNESKQQGRQRLLSEQV